MILRSNNFRTKIRKSAHSAQSSEAWLNYLSVFSAKDIAAVDTERVAQKYLNVLQAGLELESKTGFFIYVKRNFVENIKTIGLLIWKLITFILLCI